MQYWHVAPQDYCSGWSLHAPRELRRLAGIPDPPADQRAEYDETVLLFLKRSEAETHRKRHGGVLVRVELPDAPFEVADYHKHWRRIPAEWVHPADAIGVPQGAAATHAA